MEAASFVAKSWSRSTSATFAPYADSVLQNCLPNIPAPPVTTAVLLLKSNRSIGLRSLIETYPAPGVAREPAKSVFIIKTVSVGSIKGGLFHTFQKSFECFLECRKIVVQIDSNMPFFTKKPM